MKKLFLIVVLFSASAILAQKSLTPITEVDYYNATRYTGARNIARTTAGDVVVVFEPGSGYTNMDIWYAVYNSVFTHWDVAQLSKSSTNATGIPAVIAVDSSHIYAAWKEKATDGKRNAMFSKCTFIDQFTHQWTDPVVADTIDNNTGVCTIDADSYGNPFVMFSIWNDPAIFKANIYVSHSTDDGTTWATDNLTSVFPTPNKLPINYLDVNLASGKNGIMYAAWEDKPEPYTTQYEVLFSKYDPQNGWWTKPEIVTPINDGVGIAKYVDGYVPTDNAVSVYQMGPAEYKLAGLSTVIYNETSTSKSLISSFNPYYQFPASQRDQYLKDVVNFFGVGSSDSVLVVDDDNYHNNDTVVTKVLDELGVQYRVFDCGNNSGMATAIPSFDSDLSGKKLVIWFTGDDYKDLAFWNIADQDNPELKKYLDESGSQLFVCGRSWMYDRYGNAPDTLQAGDFAYDYLGISIYAGQSWSDDGNVGVTQLDNVYNSLNVSSVEQITWMNAGTRQGEPSIACDPSGKLHMVYYDANGMRILYKTYSDGVWSDSIRIDNSADTVQVMRPNIAIDPNYGIYVTWVQETSKNADGKRIYNVFYATSPDGGKNWNAPVQLSNTDYMDDSYYSVKNPTIGKRVCKAIPGVFDGGADVVWTEASSKSSLGYYIMYARIPYVGTITDVEKDGIKPVKFALEQNYPNPFNPTTTIKYSIPAAVGIPHMRDELSVRLTVYDILGRKITTLVNKAQKSGNYSVRFNANNLPSGIYFYRLQAGDFTATRKMILLK